MSTDVLPETQTVSETPDHCGTAALARPRHRSGFSTWPMVETRSAGDRRGRRGRACRHADPRRHFSAGVRSQTDAHDHAWRPGRLRHRTRDVGELQQYGNQMQGPRLQHRHLGDRGRYGGEGRRRTGQAGYEANRGCRQSANDECYHTAMATLEQSKAEVAKAEIAISAYLEGTYRSQLKSLERELKIAKANLLTAQKMLDHSEQLFKLGYVTELEVEGNAFTVTQAELELNVKKTAARSAGRIHQEDGAGDAQRQLDRIQIQAGSGQGGAGDGQGSPAIARWRSWSSASSRPTRAAW